MIVDLIVVRGKDMMFGFLVNKEDLEMTEDRLISLYQAMNKTITKDDLEVLEESFELTKETYKYNIIDSIENKSFTNTELRLSLKDTQRLVDFSKQVPNYTEDDLYQAINLIHGSYFSEFPTKIYW